jgi:agmatinase
MEDIMKDILGPPDATKSPRYGGFPTFARLPRLDQVEHYDVAVVGVPFDSGVSYRPGARFGPAHIRQSSRLLRPYNPALNRMPFASQQVVDAGDIDCNPFNIPEALAAIEAQVGKLSSGGRRVVTLGGDHTIALPILRTLHRQYGPLTVVHFDAHLDTWNSYFGMDTTHGTPFRRASEEGLINTLTSVHVGTRGPLYSATDLSDDQELGFQVISSVDLQDHGLEWGLQRLRDRVGDTPIYISIDIDVLDPAHAPGTGTPEAGGLTSRELLGFVRSFATQNVVGADVVEVAPAYDHAEITGIAAAHVAYELLSVMAR